MASKSSTKTSKSKISQKSKDIKKTKAHNPALTELVNALTGHYSLDNLPTAGYIELSLQIDHWRDLLQGCAVIDYKLFPRQLHH